MIKLAFLFALLMDPACVGPVEAHSPGHGLIRSLEPLAAPVQDPPELLTFDYSIGGTNANITLVGWQPNGKVQFLCDTDGGTDRTSSWSIEGTTQSSVPVANLTVTEEYTLYYRIDPIPDYAGWDEDLWRIIVAPTDPNLPTWTQPGKNDPIVGDWEPEG